MAKTFTITLPDNLEEELTAQGFQQFHGIEIAIL